MKIGEEEEIEILDIIVDQEDHMEEVIEADLEIMAEEEEEEEMNLEKMIEEKKEVTKAMLEDDYNKFQLMFS